MSKEKLEQLKKQLESREKNYDLQQEKEESLIPENELNLQNFKGIVSSENRYWNNQLYRGLEKKLFEIEDDHNKKIDYIIGMLEEFILKKKG
jgi:hypothetical protein